MANALRKGMEWIVPTCAVGFLCGVCFYAGMQVNDSPAAGKYLIADKNAVILNAVLERNSTDQKALEKEIVMPVLQVLRRYSDQGYVVIDGARNDQGHFSVAALPAGARDITPELSAAIGRKGERK